MNLIVLTDWLPLKGWGESIPLPCCCNAHARICSYKGDA